MPKTIPFDFILEELAELDPIVKPMFGCHAIYVDGKICLIVREKDEHIRDNGIWIATTAEHHPSLKKDFPNMRSIEVFGGDGPTGWQIQAVDTEDFEEKAFLLCELVKKRDPRIGKVPKAKSLRKNKIKKKTTKKAK